MGVRRPLEGRPPRPTPQVTPAIPILLLGQTAVRRRATAMPLLGGLLRLRGFFFLGIRGQDINPRGDHEKAGATAWVPAFECDQ